MPRARKPALAKNEPVYGDVKARNDQMAALPIPQGGAVAPPQVSATPAAGLPEIIPLDAETRYPDQPITAGLRTGAGPGPEALGMGDLPAEVLRQVYQQYPTEEIRELIEDLETQGR